MSALARRTFVLDGGIGEFEFVQLSADFAADLELGANRQKLHLRQTGTKATVEIFAGTRALEEQLTRIASLNLTGRGPAVWRAELSPHDAASR